MDQRLPLNDLTRTVIKWLNNLGGTGMQRGGVCECDGIHQENLKRHVGTNLHKKQMLCMSPSHTFVLKDLRFSFSQQIQVVPWSKQWRRGRR